MHVYGLQIKTVLFGENIDPAYESMYKGIKTVGPREYVVTDQYGDRYGRITHCLTWNNLSKAHKRNEFYVRDANLQKIQTVQTTSLTIEEILKRLTQKHRGSLFLTNGSDPKKLSLRDLVCEIPLYYGMDAVSKKRHPKNCPYDYCFEVK